MYIIDNILHEKRQVRSRDLPLVSTSSIHFLTKLKPASFRNAVDKESTLLIQYTGVKAKLKSWAWTFSPGGGLVAGVDTYAGLLKQTNKKTLFEWFSIKQTKSQTTEIVLFKINNGKLNTWEWIYNRKYTKTVYYRKLQFCSINTKNNNILQELET